MEPLEIFPNIWLIDLAVHLPEQRALVIADLHLGYEEALHRGGVLVPRQHLRLIEERLVRILEHLEPRPRRLVINGDLKHRFAPPSGGEWREALGFLEFSRGRFEEIVLLRGNHDANIEYLVERSSGLKVQECLQEDRLLLLHGDRRPHAGELDGVELILIGHEHPAVGLRSVAGRMEIYKAFLLGEYHGKRLLVQPSFNLLVPGNDLTRERAISPLISEDGLREFAVYPVADEGEIYEFGPLAPFLQP